MGKNEAMEGVKMEAQMTQTTAKTAEATRVVLEVTEELKATTVRTAVSTAR